jgi:hypothetical protein
MARIRSVKPSLRTSRVVAQWKFEVRYFWVLLWGYLDDKGRGLDLPKAIAGDCFPLDENVTPSTVNRWLDLIASTKIESDRIPPLCRYEVGGIRYLHALNFGEHQKPNRPSPSQHPPCPVHESFSEPGSESLSESPLSPHVLEVEGLTEGEFGGAPREPLTEPAAPSELGPQPPQRCTKHENIRNPPNCGSCGDARREHNRWQKAYNDRLADAPKCRLHRGEPANNCGRCRSEELNPA